MLGPVLYLLCTYNIPQTEHVTIATHVNDTAILAVGHANEETADKLQ